MAAPAASAPPSGPSPGRIGTSTGPRITFGKPAVSGVTSPGIGLPKSRFARQACTDAPSRCEVGTNAPQASRVVHGSRLRAPSQDRRPTLDEKAEPGPETPMYVEGGWKPPWEPPRREPWLTKRQERVLIWLIAVNALLLLIAPIGGATVIQAILAILRRG